MQGQRTLSRQDVIAGISLAGLLLPSSIAYASLADLPPQAGIIALFAGLLTYFLLGNSRFAIVSATSSSAVVLAAGTTLIAAGENTDRPTIAVLLVLITGVFFILAALLRLGRVTHFIAKPVLRGFTFGLALIIVSRQIASILGLSLEYHDFFSFVLHLFQQWHRWNIPSIAVGLLALIALLLLERFNAQAGYLIVIVIFIALAYFTPLSPYGIHLVGQIDMNWHTATFLPLSLVNIWQLLGLGLALALILYAESYAAITSFALKHGDHINPNRDLFALGCANLISGVCSGQTVGAGYSQTAASEGAGGQSKYTGLICAFILMLILASCLPFIALIPQVVLAAIVIFSLRNAFRLEVFRPYFTWQRDRFILVMTIIGVLTLGIVQGLVLAIVLSVILLLKNMVEAQVTQLGRLGKGHDFVDLSTHQEARTLPHTLILRPNQPLFFANSDKILTLLKAQIKAVPAHTKIIIVSLEETPDLDGTSLEMLTTFFQFIERHQKQLILCRLKTPVYSLVNQLIYAPSLPIKLTELSVAQAVTLAKNSAKPL